MRELVRPMVSPQRLAVQEGHGDVVRALLEVGGRELAMITRGNGVSSLHQCGEGASGGGESAAGGRGARAAGADRGRWRELSVCCTRGKPGGGLEVAGDGVPERRLVLARDHGPQAWLNLATTHTS